SVFQKLNSNQCLSPRPNLAHTTPRRLRLSITNRMIQSLLIQPPGHRTANSPFCVSTLNLKYFISLDSSLTCHSARQSSILPIVGLLNPTTHKSSLKGHQKRDKPKLER